MVQSAELLLLHYLQFHWRATVLFSGIILPIILITLTLLQCTRQYFAWVQRYIREQDPRKEKRKVKYSERLAMNHVKRVSDVLDVYEESRVEQEVRKS
ncbi:MAG: hypothetical protein AAFQ07_06760, partial [Chloroflexota bacterium]